MVLTLKRWKSRSSPGITAGGTRENPFTVSGPKALSRRARMGPFCVAPPKSNAHDTRGVEQPANRPGHSGSAHKTLRATQHARFGDAGWSSPVARQAHNLKVAGSNPAPATNSNKQPNLTPPDPISNSAVKPDRADGTNAQALEE